jgi:outer membrane protein
MMKKALAISALAVTLAVPSLASAQATQADGPWLVRLRAINIDPNPSNSQTGTGGFVPSNSINISSTWAPEVDISYFFTPNIALELVLTYPQKHNVSVSGVPGVGDVGSIKQLPPSLFAQYHFNTGTPFKPYVGAGLTWFYITDNNLNVNGASILDVRKSNWGFGLQAGLDYALTKNWYLNADVKYIWVETELTDTAGLGIDTKLKVNPWVWGLGVGYRF